MPWAHQAAFLVARAGGSDGPAQPSASSQVTFIGHKCSADLRRPRDLGPMPFTYIIRIIPKYPGSKWVEFIPFSLEASGVWGPAARRFFAKCLYLADDDRDIDVYHWSSAKFSS